MTLDKSELTVTLHVDTHEVDEAITRIKAQMDSLAPSLWRRLVWLVTGKF